MTNAPTRLPGVELLKVVASQLIVLHHLSAYGPLSDAAAGFWPDVSGWLYAYGRMAVQVFLVVGGFLAARALSPRDPQPARPPLAPIGRRFLRLAVPYWGALGLSVAGAVLADDWMDDESIPGRPSVLGALAHALMLQDLLGVDSVLAGAWYVPIDFQLYGVAAILLWAGRSAVPGRLLVLALAAASLLVFNRDARWDVWAIYFFGAYGLGAAAAWSADRRGSPAWFAAIAAVAVAALALDFRPRIAIALAVALTLVLGGRTGVLERWPRSRAVSFLARISFALFLVHFPVLLVANGASVQVGADSPAAVGAALAATWAAAMGLAVLFHRFVEAPAARALAGRPGGRGTPGSRATG